MRHNRQSTMIYTTILLTIMLSLVPSLADDSATHPHTLRLGVNNWLFWRGYQDGEFSGADVEIWREIAKRNNLELECKFIPDFQVLKTSMENDSIDVFVGMLKNDERESYMYFIEPPYRTKLLFQTFARAGSDLQINKLKDLHGLKMAIVGGGYDQINNDPQISAEASLWWPDKPFEKLLSGEIDIVHINEWLATSYFVEHENQDQFVKLSYSHSEYHPSFMVMAKKSRLPKEWADTFGNTIQQMIDDGTIKNIINRYVPGWYE